MDCATPVDSWDAEVVLKPAPKSSTVPSAKRPSAANCDALSPPTPYVRSGFGLNTIRVLYLGECFGTYTPAQT